MTNKIIIDSMEQITCPECRHEFPLSEGITRQLIERREHEFADLLSTEKSKLRENLLKDIEKQVARDFQDKLEQLNDQLADARRAQKKASAQLEQARKAAAEEVRQELGDETNLLKQQLDEKNKKLSEFRASELALREEKQKLEEQKQEMAVELQRRLDESKQQIQSNLQAAFALKEADLVKKITDAQKSNEELTRKLQQGSQQLQGEVLELGIEELLQREFIFDTIESVAKGTRGADVVQTVNLRSGTSCGKIVWEIKRTENWSNKWVAKLKQDMQSVGGDIAVLVSTAFPTGVDEAMVLHEGVWLVKPIFVKPMAEALRMVLIESQRQKSIAVSKGEQMESLFDYICSNQFAQRIRSVVEGYEVMRSDLEKEKSAMQRIWTKREAQISQISRQVMGVCGELQGISATALPHLDNIAELEAISLI